jgi:hypothetical protein
VSCFIQNVEIHSAHDYERRASFQISPDPRAARPTAACYKHTAGLGPASVTEPFNANGRKMNSWYAKFPDWRMGVTWLVAMAVAGVIYFAPLAHLLAQFAD